MNMPKKTPVILLVGHGSVSAKKTVIDVGNYNVILPTKAGDKLCLIAHNMIVCNLTSANTSDEIFYELKKLENLPSTTSVSKDNIKTLQHTLNLNLGNHTIREQLEKLLREAEVEALDSQRAWELLEHQISPALEILNTGKAFIPTKFNSSYQEFPLLYKEFIDKVQSNQPVATLDILINSDKIKFQVNTLKSKGETTAKLSEDQVVYMTPYGINNETPKLNLSMVLKFLPLMHIIITSTKTQDLSNSYEEIKSFCICLSDYLETENFKQEHILFNNTHPGTTWYDITIPEDSNIVLGACRDLDSSF